MTKKKKDFIPKDYEDLLKIWYGPNIDGRNIDYSRKRRYIDAMKQGVLSTQFEDVVKKMFTPFCKLEKIKEKKEYSSFDYKNDVRKLLLEVTTLDVDDSYWLLKPLSKDDIFLKLRVVIDHILEKDDSQFLGYRKGGAVIYTLTFNLASGFSELLDEKLPEKSGMFDNDLDFLAFITQPASIRGKSSWEVNPPVIYVKNKSLYEEFKKAFLNSNYNIFE